MSKTLRKESVQVKFKRALELEALTKDLNKELKQLKVELKELFKEHNETELKAGSVKALLETSTSMRFSKDLYIEKNGLESYNSYKQETEVNKLILKSA